MSLNDADLAMIERLIAGGGYVSLGLRRKVLDTVSALRAAWRERDEAREAVAMYYHALHSYRPVVEVAKGMVVAMEIDPSEARALLVADYRAARIVKGEP